MIGKNQNQIMLALLFKISLILINLNNLLKNVMIKSSREEIGILKLKDKLK